MSGGGSGVRPADPAATGACRVFTSVADESPAGGIPSRGDLLSAVARVEAAGAASSSETLGDAEVSGAKAGVASGFAGIAKDEPPAASAGNIVITVNEVNPDGGALAVAVAVAEATGGTAEPDASADVTSAFLTVADDEGATPEGRHGDTDGELVPGTRSNAAITFANAAEDDWRDIRGGLEATSSCGTAAGDEGLCAWCGSCSGVTNALTPPPCSSQTSETLLRALHIALLRALPPQPGLPKG